MRLARFSQWLNWEKSAASAGFCFTPMRCNGSPRNLFQTCSSLTRILFLFARTNFMGPKARGHFSLSRRCIRNRFYLAAVMKMNGALGRKISLLLLDSWKLSSDLSRTPFFPKKDSLLFHHD